MREGAGWTRAAIILGILTVAAPAATFSAHSWVTGTVCTVILAAAAVRCWVLGR